MYIVDIEKGTRWVSPSKTPYHDHFKMLTDLLSLLDNQIINKGHLLNNLT